jgi:hypothetical protein
MQTSRDMQTSRHADMQTCRHADMQTCRHADMQTYRHTDIQTYMYRHTNMPTDFQEGSHGARQTDRQMNTFWSILHKSFVENRGIEQSVKGTKKQRGTDRKKVLL